MKQLISYRINVNLAKPYRRIRENFRSRYRIDREALSLSRPIERAMRRSRSLRLICVAVGFYPIHVKTSGEANHIEQGEQGKERRGNRIAWRRKERRRERGGKKSCQVKTTRTAPINPGKTPNFGGEKVFARRGTRI